MKSKDRKSKVGNISLKDGGKKAKTVGSKSAEPKQSGPVEASPRMSRITKSEQIEGALHEGEVNYRGVFENSLIGVFQSTPEGQFLNVNQAMADLYGFHSPKEMLAGITDIATQIHANPVTRKEFERLLSEKGHVSEFTNQNRRKDGAIIWTSTSARAVKDQDGKIRYYEGFVTDISGRKQAEENRRDADQRYRFLFENMLNGLAYCQMIFDNGQPRDFIYLDVNQTFEELTGLKDVVGKKVSKVIPGLLESNPELFKRYGRVALTGKSETFETYVEPLKRWFSISVYSPQAGYFVAVFDVITERKQAEETLRESEQRLTSVYETVGDVIFQLEVEREGRYRFISVNREFVTTTGLTSKQVVGKLVNEIIPEPSLSKALEKYAEAIRKKQIVRWEEISEYPTGKLIGEVSIAPTFDEAGNCTHLVGAVHDVTRRKEAEEELRQSREVLRQSFASMHDALFIVDAKTVEITDCNPAASEMFGYDRSEIVGQTTAFLHVNKEALTDFRRRLDEAVHDVGFLYLPEYRMKKKDGTIFSSDHTVTPLRDGQGRTTGWVSVVRDISERESKEGLLAESVSRYKGLFEDSPISLWEEDFSAVKKQLDALRAEGITDFPEYFASHPEVVTEYEGLIKVLDVNKATLRLFGANQKEDILHSLATIFEGQPAHVFQDELVNIAAGKTRFTWEGINKTLDGRLRNIDLVWSVAPGFEESLSEVLVLVTDITERKQAEKLQDAVYRIASAAVTSGSLDDLYEEIHRIISGVMHAENFYITLYDEERDLLKFPYFKDVSDEPYLKDARPERGLTAYVLRTGKSLLCTQAVHDELERQGEVKLLGTPSSIWLGVPLSIEGKTIGAMVVQHYSDPEAYGVREQHMLEYVSAQVAPAIRRKQAEEDVRTSEARYRALFEDSPISLWLEDFSAVKKRLDSWRQDGITNFEEFFAAHPEAVKECATLTKILDANRSTLAMHSAKRKEDLLKNLAETLEGPSLEGFRNELVKIAAGETSFQREGVNKTQDGRLINIHLNWSVVPGFEESLSRVMISIIDITERKRAEAERQALLEIMQGLVITDSLQKFLELMRVSLNKVLDAKNLIVVFHDKYSGMFEEVFTADEYDKPIPASKLEHSITSYVFRTGEPLLLTEEKFQELMKLGEVELVGHKQASWLGAPIKTPNETIGVIAVQNYEIPNSYSERDKTFLASVGTQVALAIERKRSEDKLENQLHWLSALRAIDSAISSSFDLRVTLDLLLTQVTTELRVDAADVLLLNRNSNELVYAAGRGFRGTGISRMRLKLGDDSTGKAVLERRTINIPNLAEATRPLAQAKLVADEGFVAFYAVPLMTKGQAKGVLELFHRTALDPDPDWLNFLETLAGETAIAIDNAQLFEELQRSNMELALAYDATIEGWSEAMDMRDKETEGHTQRVTDEAVKLARALELPEREVTDLRRGALLHDIGKMGLPDAILQKPEPLTDEEAILMKKHPTLAFEMLSHVRYLQPAINIPYCHHEKWDGTGYPRGLKGDQIPLSARIFAVVDVYDALVSDRPYRSAWPQEKALEYIRSESGKEFDPLVAETFLNMKAEQRHE